MGIKWNPIKGYEEFYLVSSLGDVASLYRITGNSQSLYKRKVRILKKMNNGHGYFNVCLYKNGGNKKYYIHRLVAEAFIPNPDNKEQINHKDGDKSNNHIGNLEWCTETENKRHSSKIGFIANGERQGLTTLTWNEVDKIRKEYKKGVFGFIRLAHKYNTSPAAVCRIIKGKSWNNPIRRYRNYDKCI